jgi:hypothetical protein
VNALNNEVTDGLAQFRALKFGLWVGARAARLMRLTDKTAIIQMRCFAHHPNARTSLMFLGEQEI